MLWFVPSSETQATERQVAGVEHSDTWKGFWWKIEGGKLRIFTSVGGNLLRDFCIEAVSSLEDAVQVAQKKINQNLKELQERREWSQQMQPKRDHGHDGMSH